MRIILNIRIVESTSIRVVGVEKLFHGDRKLDCLLRLAYSEFRVLTLATAPLSYANVMISFSIDMLVEFASQLMKAIQGAVAVAKID
jgi:hypothetical protein